MKKSYLSALRPLPALFLLILFTGCSSSGLSSMTPHERVAFDQVMSENITPGEVISQAEKSLEEATEAQLDFYAPNTLKTATSLIEEANELLVKKGVNPKEVIYVAIKAKQAIASGFTIKDQVVEHLAISMSEKKRLDDLDTQAIFPDEYKTTMAILKQMIELIEEKKPEEATGMQTAFTEKTAALLIKTLCKITLDEARKVLAEAESKDAKRYAPVTFEAASLKLKQAETFIRTYPRDREGIQKIGIETLQAATHALTVTREVKMLNALETDSIEGFVLSIEKQIHGVRHALGHSEITYDTLRTQLEGLIETAGTIATTASYVPDLEKTKNTLNTNLDAEKEKTISLEKQVTELKGSLAAAKTDREQGDQKNNSLSQENTDLKTQFETLKLSLNEAMAEKQETEEKLTAEQARALQEITQLKRSITELEMKVSDAEKERVMADGLKTKIQALEVSNKDFQEKISSLQSDKDRGLDEISNLKGTISKLKTDLEHKNADLKQTENKAEEVAKLTATTN